MPPSSSQADDSDTTIHAGAALALLNLYREWGVDCTLEEAPLNRMAEKARPLPSRKPNTRVQPEPTRPASGVPPVDVTDMASLHRAISSFTECALSRTATHTLLPVHVENASLMIVGETPDADEDRSGTLFAGASGDMLDRLLGSIGLSRHTMSQAAALPWRPPGGRDVTPLEIRQCRPLLLQAIALCRPERLILFGATPTRMLMGEPTVLTRVRGRWEPVSLPDGSAIPALPMRHPLQVHVSARARQDMWRDLLHLAETIDP